MNGKQPATGIIAAAIVIVLSLGFVSLFSFPTFAGWVAFYMQCTIPMQIVVGINWRCKFPEFASRQSQPMKGLLLTLVTVVGGIVSSIVYLAGPGGNVTPPTPMLEQFTIVSVVVTFWASIIWGGWPFRTLIRNPVASGITQLVACYAAAFGLFKIFFNFDFMREAAVYVPSLDPHGLFNAWNVLVFFVTGLAALFLMLHFDLWPLTKSPPLMKQPLLGIVWTMISLMLAAAVYSVSITVMGMDAVKFLVSVPIPFIFGTIIALNMLEGWLFKKRKQPVKGVLSAAAAALIGTGLAWLYAAVVGVVTGKLHSGPPSYDFEIWLASALLGVTFPFLIISGVFFDFWPIKSEMWGQTTHSPISSPKKLGNE